MVATIWSISKLNYAKVAYYTVEVEGRGRTEFFDFQTRMKNVPEYLSQLGSINQFIKEIGEKHGAHELHFKHERRSEALPPPYFIQPEDGPSKYGLRLYCVRLSPSIVVLLNGDLKTHDYPDQCPNCARHFALANKISRKIDEAIKERRLRLDGKNIEAETNDDYDLFL